ncbi:MAG: amidohydrolase family protein [Planctomycetales bacterium]|nr:amidohydrolase family protein [Planctomycetales bacterium]
MNHRCDKSYNLKTARIFHQFRSFIGSLSLCLLLFPFSTNAHEPYWQSENTQPTKQENSESVEGTGDATPTLALVGATIHTLGPQNVIDNGVVLISGDRILSVGGPELTVPDGVPTLDVSQLVMTPGLIDASSQLWLTSAAVKSTASDASLNALDGVDGYDEQWQEVIRHGVTSVYVQPASNGTLGGYGAVLSVFPTDDGPAVIKSFAALQASIGVGASNNRVRMQQFDRTKKSLNDAAEYQEKWDEYNEYLSRQEAADKKAAAEKESSTGRSGGSPDGRDSSVGPRSRIPTGRGRPTQRGVGTESESKGTDGADNDSSQSKDAKEGGENESNSKEESQQGKKAPEKPKQDDTKERLAKVVNGQIPLRLEIHSADDAHYALKLIKEFPKMQVVLSGLSDLRSAKDDILALTLPIVLGPWLSTEANYRDDPDSRSDWTETFGDYPGALVIASAGTSDRSSRLLRAHVGQAIASGIDEQRALKTVTLHAARVLGVDDQIGSLEAGKRADMVCFRGNPADISSSVCLVIAAGRVAFQEPGEISRTNISFPSSHVAGPLEVPPTLGERFAIRSQNALQRDGSFEPRTIMLDTSNSVVSMAPLDAPVDEGLEIIDAGQAWVTPGLFSAHATLGLESLLDPDLSDATDVVAGDVITIDFERENKCVQQGLLRVLLAPGDKNTIAGQSSLVQLGSQNQVVVREAGLKFNLTNAARDPVRFPSSLAGQSQMIAESLAGQLLDTRLYLPDPVQKRLSKQRTSRLDSLAKGKTWTIISVDSDADIRVALDLIERHQLKAALVGARQLRPFLGRLSALNVAVIARPLEASDYNWYPQDLALASQAGIDVFFAGESAEQLRLTASLAVEAGMSPQRALLGLCYGPAQLAHGNAESSDLVVWSQSPLNLGAKPLCVIVDGRIVSMSQRGDDDKE